MEALCKKNKKIFLHQEKYHRLISEKRRPCAKQSQQHSHHAKITSSRRSAFGLISQKNPVQSDEQNSGAFFLRKEAERIEFEKVPDSTTFVTWKMNFNNEVYSSSSFLTEAMVSINEVDSARNTNELKSSTGCFLISPGVLRVTGAKWFHN